MSGSEWIPSAGTETRGRDVQLGSPDRLLPPVVPGCEACGRSGHSLSPAIRRDSEPLVWGSRG